MLPYILNSTTGKHERNGWGIVESYPLCDNVLPYSIGIHTCNVRRLRDGQVFRISGHLVYQQGD